MDTATAQAVGVALGALIVALLGYLTAYVRANGATLAAHTIQLAAAPTARVAGAGRATDRAGGAGQRNPYPLWNQLQDPLPDGVLPHWRYEECGEECVAEIIARVHGVEVGADALRAQLGGPGRRGLTTGGDLVRLLDRNNVPATAVPVGVDNVADQLQAATRDGRAVIALGSWIAPSVLHWILVTRADERGCSFNDPWGGVRKSLEWAPFRTLYGGEVVVVLRRPDPNGRA